MYAAGVRLGRCQQRGRDHGAVSQVGVAEILEAEVGEDGDADDPHRPLGGRAGYPRRQVDGDPYGLAEPRVDGAQRLRAERDLVRAFGRPAGQHREVAAVIALTGAAVRRVDTDRGHDLAVDGELAGCYPPRTR